MNVQLCQQRRGDCPSLDRALSAGARFALKQALALYDAYTGQLRECDGEIEGRFQAIKPLTHGELPPGEWRGKGTSHSKNAPSYDARSFLYQVTGVDLVAIPGFNASACKPSLGKLAGT